MNDCIILKHFKTGSGTFTEERCFHDIIDFSYSVTGFDGNYILDGFRLDEYTKEEIPVSYIIGFYENDYIYYNGRKFYSKDFPTLATIIHNRNINRELEVLE